MQESTTPSEHGVWQKAHAYWVRHKLHIVIVATTIIYIVTRYIRVEFLGHGCELLVEPTIELLLIKFTGIGD